MNPKRTPILAGNWKMNKTPKEAKDLAKALVPLLARVKDREIVLAPPFTALAAVAETIYGTNMVLAAQNLHWEAKGAFTGEISAEMLLESGCKYVIIGHSERRQYFGETDETANKRVRAALSQGLRPILCIGETLAEREAGRVGEIIVRQLEGGLSGITAADMRYVVIAYEPVWAIGTGKTAAPEQANDVHRFIRDRIEAVYGPETAGAMRIQYGGSVTPENAKTLMAMPEIDGALVGGASLKPDSFAAIVKF